MRIVAQGRGRGVDVASGVRVSLRIYVQVDVHRGRTLRTRGERRRWKLELLLAGGRSDLNRNGLFLDRGVTSVDVARRSRVGVVLQVLAWRPDLRLNVNHRLLFGAPGAAALGIDWTEAVELTENVIDV